MLDKTDLIYSRRRESSRIVVKRTKAKEKFRPLLRCNETKSDEREDPRPDVTSLLIHSSSDESPFFSFLLAGLNVVDKIMETRDKLQPLK
ncbi:Hypothetical protein SMAX5B_002804 [Scophthalmus maximus]|uniref:Uncharacterized protein n=1 Tax=Scophthalmus maximus TaxID=52904 RepID=A0A2U9BER9_SCOMX|nr:Hypothetical protein SMAX5B_002804 [Scophthalmus maximus]